MKKCAIFVAGGEFLSRRGNNFISACCTTLLLDLNKCLSNDQSDCSFLSRDHKFIYMNPLYRTM